MSTAATITPNALHWNTHTIRALERKSIRDFVELYKRVLTGRVLDFGAGKPGTCAVPQPYRDMVSGEYVPYDKGDDSPFGQFDAILCTQVFQFLGSPVNALSWFHSLLKSDGFLLLTYATCWDEVEDEDLFRYTKKGMEKLLVNAEFRIFVHERRAEIDLGGFKFPLGYGCLAAKQ